MTFAWNLNNMALRVMYFREDPWLLNDLTTALSNAKVQKSTVMRDVCGVITCVRQPVCVSKVRSLMDVNLLITVTQTS